MNTDSGSNLISNLKSHTGNIFRKSVRILLKDRIDRFLIFLINLCAQVQGNPIFLQKDHYFSHLCLLTYLRSDLPGFFLTDPLYLCKPLRLFFYDTECVISKLPHDPGSQCSTDSPDGARTQITFYSICILRHLLCKRTDLKLFAIYRMMDIYSGCFNRCPLCDRRETSHAGQLFLFFCTFQYHNCISVIFISKNNMIYVSCDSFTHVLFSTPPASLSL